MHTDGQTSVHLVSEMPFDLSVLGGFSVKFRYTKDGLQSAYGFDPINLPLSLCYAESSAQPPVDGA